MLSDEFISRAYWQSRAPGLHIEEGIAVANYVPGPVALADHHKRLSHEGYFQVRHAWDIDLELMVATVRAFSAADISPVFCFLYDEFWAPFHALAPLYRALLGDYAVLPDFWVWNVDPKKGEAGWSPHRDKGQKSLFPDGTPKSLTTWIALSRATPLNGCMHLVPAHLDPVYRTEREYKIDPKVARALARPLPAKAGEFFVWNQAVLHWGGQSSPKGRESRVSMAFEFQRLDVPAFNQPLLRPGADIPFDMRLKLVAKQMLQYYKLYRIDPSMERIARDLLGITAQGQAITPGQFLP